MTARASHEQVRAIHAIKGRIGLDDTAYRAALGQFGVASSKDLSRADAARFIDRLKGNDPNSETPRSRGALRLDGPYAKVCRALWLSAYNLGLAHDRRDTALSAFVLRQTGIESLNWVRDPVEGAKAIEGLKAWIARPMESGGGGVTWPTEKQAKAAGMPLSRARKLAVIAAQTRMLGAEIYDPTPFNDAELDEQAQAFGRAIRASREASPDAVRAMRSAKEAAA